MRAYAAVERPSAREAGFEDGMTTAPAGEVVSVLSSISEIGFPYAMAESGGGVGEKDFGDEFDGEVAVEGDLGENVEEDFRGNVGEWCVRWYYHRSRS